MSTIHLHRTTTATPEQYVAGLTDFGATARRSLATAPTSTSRCMTGAPRRPTSRKARAASRNACTTTGPIPATSFSRRPTPTCGEVHRATPTTSRVIPTAPPTLTWSSYATARTSKGGGLVWCWGPSAGAFWKGHSKTPSRPSKPGTTRLST